MPELPEVESVRRQLDPELTDRRVEDAWWDPHPALPRQFMGLELLAGRRVLRVGRRGKFMIAPLDEDLELILHLGMTGSFRFDLEDPHVRAKLSLDDGRTLSFRDVRRFGRMAVVESGDYGGIPTLKMLGPEPLTDDFDPDRFAARLKRTSAPIKPYLLSQRPVAYSVEEDHPGGPGDHLLPEMPASLNLPRQASAPDISGGLTPMSEGFLQRWPVRRGLRRVRCVPSDEGATWASASRASAWGGGSGAARAHHGARPRSAGS